MDFPGPESRPFVPTIRFLVGAAKATLPSNSVAATMMLEAGVPMPTASHILGHANPGVTMKLYAHLIDGTSGMAATGMDEALR